jgi:hypothetical protein
MPTSSQRYLLRKQEAPTLIPARLRALCPTILL